jgi:hypothetical protein
LIGVDEIEKLATNAGYEKLGDYKASPIVVIELSPAEVTRIQMIFYSTFFIETPKGRS